MSIFKSFTLIAAAATAAGGVAFGVVWVNNNKVTLIVERRNTDASQSN